MTIPTELTARKQWVNWRYGDLRKDGKCAKPPYIPGTNRKASSTNPTTWGDFETAEDDISQEAVQIGYVFTKEDGFAGIDLDHCIENNKVLPWAKNIVLKFNSYTEVSPSGTGLHILVRTSDLLPSLNRGNIEIYTHDRYFTMTGHHLKGTPTTIEDRTELLNKFHAKVLSSPPQGVEGPIMSLEAEKLPVPPVEDKWALLAAGDWRGAGYDNQTPADLAYANHLRGTTKRDREAAEELFRESGLYTSREPSEAERKLGLAFDKAFEGVTERQRGRFVAMTEIEESLKGLEWAWENWIPKGHVTMIAGATGLGKSYFAAALLTAVCGHETWPDGSSPMEIGDVFLTETENMKVVYANRLRILGIDDSKGKVHFGPQLDVYETEQLDADGFALDLQAGFEEYHPKMLVIDSFSGAHDKKENEAAMRKLMRTLTLWASKLNIPIVIVHHERKKDREAKAKTDIDRVRGSTTITQLCRSVIAIWRVGEDDTVRIGVIKSNFEAFPPDLGMQISGGRPKFVPPPQVVEKETAVSRAVDFLEDFLKDGAKLATEVQEAYEAAGHSKTSFNRARRELRVKAYRVGDVWYNELRGEEFIKLTGEPTAEG